MKISVVVPLYNQKEYIADCLDSILNQTVLPLEVLVINDGSTDGSDLIAKHYSSSLIRVINQVNKGLSSARNTGIMNAKGDFVLFIDSDDMLLENAVEEIGKALDTVDMTDLRYGDAIAPSFKCFGLSSEEIILMDNPRLEDFKIGNRIGSCVCVSRQAMLEMGGYSPKMLHGYEDLHLTVNLLTKRYKILTLPKVLWLYRVKENSMALTAKDHHKELLDQINYDFPEAKLDF